MIWWTGFADERWQDDGYRPIAAAQGDGDDAPGPAAGTEAGDAFSAAMPWALSALAHAAMVLLTVFIVFSTIEQVRSPEIIIPSAQLSPTPGSPPLMMNRVEQDQANRRTPQSARMRDVAAQLDAGRQPAMARVAAGGGDGLAIMVRGAGASQAKGDPFASAARTAEDFRVPFYGIGGNARSVVYCLDASGSLVDTLPLVLQELKRSVAGLSERQQFTVIFFQGREAVEVNQPRPGLKRATGETKRVVFSFLDPESGQVVPSGATNPVQAIELALRYRPDLIFLLSDNITGRGRWAVDQRRLLRAIEQANRSQTRISTIQFVYPDPLAGYGLKPTMQMIAEQHGGVYKFVDARELGIGAPPATVR